MYLLYRPWMDLGLGIPYYDEIPHCWRVGGGEVKVRVGGWGLGLDCKVRTRPTRSRPRTSEIWMSDVAGSRAVGNK